MPRFQHRPQRKHQQLKLDRPLSGVHDLLNPIPWCLIKPKTIYRSSLLLRARRISFDRESSPSVEYFVCNECSTTLVLISSLINESFRPSAEGTSLKGVIRIQIHNLGHSSGIICKSIVIDLRNQDANITIGIEDTSKRKRKGCARCSSLLVRRGAKAVHSSVFVPVRIATSAIRPFSKDSDGKRVKKLPSTIMVDGEWCHGVIESFVRVCVEDKPGYRGPLSIQLSRSHCRI